jgi:D-glycerate 3-kinase
LNKDIQLQAFLTEHRLPPAFSQTVDHWYRPLAGLLAGHHATAGRPLLVGVNGSQGSGKSTLAALLVQLLTELHGLRAINLSIDDFYLSRASRHALASKVHPLFATRGVPGTHDVPLLRETLQQLVRSTSKVPIPRFNKASDDRALESEWAHVSAPLDIVILEGWCLGTPAQDDKDLHCAVNALEADEDPDCSWRLYINRQIREHYQAIDALIDIWIMLQAPSFNCVYDWRLEQERKLAGQLPEAAADDTPVNRIMTDEQVSRFIQHYQRLTEHTLRQLPSRVHYLFRLDSERRIVAREQPRRVRL